MTFPMACMDSLAIILRVRNRHLFVFLVAFAFFLVSSLTPFQFMAQGKDEEIIGVKMRLAIGSRPPRCDQRCRSCGKCEAVQIPIKNQETYGSPAKKVEYSRGDDVTGYKPMCWKCKCGDFFFNP